MDDIASDLERDWPMQRLLQGEVGSGKTVVALAAMLQAVGAGYQAVLVAPTQVLAEQHYETISKMVSGLTLAQPGAKETDAAADVEGAMGASRCFDGLFFQGDCGNSRHPADRWYEACRPA